MKIFILALLLLPSLLLARSIPHTVGSVDLRDGDEISKMTVEVEWTVVKKKFGYDNDSVISHGKRTLKVEPNGTFEIPEVDLGANFRRSHSVQVSVYLNDDSGKLIKTISKGFSDKNIESMSTVLQNLKLVKF